MASLKSGTFARMNGKLMTHWHTFTSPYKVSIILLMHVFMSVSTMDRQYCRIVAFFHADERPVFSGFRSASIARIARYDWVFVLVVSTQTSELPLQLSDVDLH